MVIEVFSFSASILQTRFESGELRGANGKAGSKWGETG
jgi:hypothetical protein